MTLRATLRVLLAIFCCTFGVVFTALAAEYPTQPIRMIVPYAPGGNTDVLARLLAQRLSQTLQQQVIVDNRPGGSTLIGTEALARAPADGYTIMFTTLSFSVVPSLFKRQTYDPVKDFSPISLVANLPNVFIVNTEVPAKTMQEFIAFAKANPGKLNYASTGNGSSPHLSMELLKSMAGIDANHVMYKGGSPALTDLLGGRIQAQFLGMPVALPLINSGKVRALGVTTNLRAAMAPMIPAIGETLPGYEMTAWFGLLGPAGLPNSISDRLQQEIVSILATPDMKERLIGLGAEPVGSTSGEFAALIRLEKTRYSKLIKDADIKPE